MSIINKCVKKECDYFLLKVERKKLTISFSDYT